jgi:putative integral membrane protein (TIGR02587 family)
VLFGFPLLMTMEMWWLGFHIERSRLALFIVVGLALLVGLAYYSGFARTKNLRDDVLDGLSAYAIGVVVSAAMLALLGVLRFGMPLEEIVGKVAIQSVPSGIGAILARKQLARREDEEPEKRSPTYASELFLMSGGAIFVAFNVAPTDEIEHIAYSMSAWQGVALALLSAAMLHALVYKVEFSGQERWPEDRSPLAVFYHFSLAGYGIALFVSLYILWTFGRIDDTGIGAVAMMAIVLGFPAALGAATARLII